MFNAVKKHLQKIFKGGHMLGTYEIDGPVIVYQMGKVGSRSVYETLIELLRDVPIYHAHVLEDLDNMAEAIKKQFENPVNSLAVIEQGKKLREKIDADTGQRWNLITLVRDPIARNVSRFFHGIEEVIPDIQQQLSADKISVNDLFDVFLNKWEHRSALQWFNLQFKPVFDIDVFTRPFPLDKGFDIYRNHRFSLLLIRLENLDACAEYAFKEFLGIDNIHLKKTNVSDDKWYTEIYRDFISKAVLPDSYLNEMYGSHFSKHFYSPAELDVFRAKWTQRLNVKQQG